jgi:TrmH family RNA methyltransferase
MGALLRLPVRVMTWTEIGETAQGLAVWLAAVGGTIEYTAVEWRQPAALVIGSEASGVGPEASVLGRGQITIPMARQTESLNASAAAAVILFEIARQRAAQ